MRRLTLWVAVAISLIGLLAPPSSMGSVILYDSLSIQSSYSAGNGNANAGAGVFLGTIYDLELVNDFLVPAGGARITSVFRDFVTISGTTPTLLEVNFYADVAGAPSNSLYASATVSTVNATPFTDTVFGLAGLRLDGNLDTPVLLPGGVWWLDIKPVDLGPGGDWYYAIRGSLFFGGDTYLRDGDNGAGTYGSLTWVTAESLTFGAGDASMRVDGDPVPEPATIAMIGVGLLGVARARRRSKR